MATKTPITVSEFAEKVMGIELNEFQKDYLNDAERLSVPETKTLHYINFMIYAIIKQLHREYTEREAKKNESRT